MRLINQDGLELIKSFERCKLQAYRDIVGVLTIGYGHTGIDVSEGLEITEDEAEQLLMKDLSRFEDGVCRLVTASVSDNAFSALVSFAYNVGLGNLRSSHLLAAVNDGDMQAAATQFLRWDKAGGKSVPGLLRRRQAESDLFLR